MSWSGLRASVSGWRSVSAGYAFDDALSRLEIPPPPRIAGPSRPADFGVLDLDIPEHRQPGEPAEDYVRRVAREKAGAGLLKVIGNPSAVVLGSDTEVVLDDEVFGKPRDDADAAAMLRKLSGAPTG